MASKTRKKPASAPEPSPPPAMTEGEREALIQHHRFETMVALEVFRTSALDEVRRDPEGDVWDTMRQGITTAQARLDRLKQLVWGA